MSSYVGSLGYRQGVFEPGARIGVRWWRHALLAVVALGLSLMCANLFVGSDTMSPPPAMGSMSASMDMPVGYAEQVAAAVPALMAGMCDGVCASGTATTVCSVVAVAAPITLLGLLVTRRRQPYLGLRARTTGRLKTWRAHRGWRGWSPLSPVSLCVWRV